MGVKFSATSLEGCLEKASSELNISKESLKYRIIKEEKRFFKKIVEIEVNEEDSDFEINNINLEITNKSEKEVAGVLINSGAKVEKGKIIVKEFEESNQIITIKSCKGVILLVNGERCDDITPVTEKDKIEYNFEETKALRNINISMGIDNMEAYVSIQYVSQDTYDLEDQGYCKNLVLKKKKISEQYPPYYTINELEEILKSNGIRYGILKEQLVNICNEHHVKNVLVAKGIPVQNDIPDEIKEFFPETHELINYDSKQKIDYRNRYFISNVKKDDVIAEKIPGKEGKDGIDVFGKTIKRKTSKKIFIKVGEGCILKENKVIAKFEGKPTRKGNLFTINKLYKTEKVDLESGNIYFVGDVEISGTVNEGMEVTAGDELSVGENVEYAHLNSGGQAIINGNVIKSIVTAGCDNVKSKQYLENLKIYKESIKELIDSLEQIKDTNLLGKRNYGEVINLLIEKKFKSLPKLSKQILSYNVSQGIQETPITTFIINKLMGFGTFKIKNSIELQGFLQIIEDEIEEVEELIIIPSDIYLCYSQASTIEASGSVVITGKGQYNSNITALNNIEFANNGAVCRGGILSAGSEINLKTVGSIAGISTELRVPKNGRITADIAYNNTVFCFGTKKIALEVSSKNVEAYVDQVGDIRIDKFIL